MHISELCNNILLTIKYKNLCISNLDEKVKPNIHMRIILNYQVIKWETNILIDNSIFTTKYNIRM